MHPRSSLKRTQIATADDAPVASSSAGKPTKKTRILDPSEDPANFEEEVHAALEQPASRRRKGRVKTEGYGSDSSNDEEGVVFSRKKSLDQEQDDDMFAIGENEDKEKDVPVKMKDKYLWLGDIEGQEFGKQSGSEDDEDDEPEDEDDAERRKKAGMGYEMSSFNLREEMEEGKFTEDGNYVRSYDPHGIHDRWMEGVDEKAIKQARRQKKQQDKIQREKIEAEERELQESGGKTAMELELLAMLKKGETVLEALQRLGSKAKRNKVQGKTAPTGSNVHNANGDKPKYTSDIEHVTYLASNIMSLGDTDVYSKTYEELVRDVRSSGRVDSNWEPPSADVKYEYRWAASDPVSQSSASFGPFTEDEMKAWYKASYFGSLGEKVQVRPVGGEWADWDDAIQ